MADDVVPVFDYVEMPESETVGETNDVFVQAVGVSRVNKEIEHGADIVNVAFQGGGHVLCQQQVFVLDRRHFLLHRRAFDPKAEEQDRHRGDDHEGGGKQMAKTRFQAQDPVF